MPKAKKRLVIESYTAAKAAAYSDLSKSMVNYLCRMRLVIPTFRINLKRGRGTRRRYSFGDIVALKLVGKLCGAGVSALRLKKGLLRLREQHPKITLTSLPASHLVTDGKDIFLREKGDTLERLVDGQLTFAFVIELSEIQQEILENIRKVA